ncbi:MAG TPA: argininosuccinate lyase [Vicinamibacterales bacterium]|jgi:argininosuccinate lyase|nr:argininosuccinate lyase [Vicinamibacterales bacterium]
MKFADEYVSCVLNENFEDAKAQFLLPLMSIHRAHLVMLAERGILPRPEARALRTALDQVPLEAVKQVKYDGTYEDLFFYVERLIVEGCGEETAGRLHTARSRNDIDMAMYRMQQRRLILALAGAGLALRETLLEHAAQHRQSVYAAHTHTQPAQPSTIAHYLLAVVEQLERDTARLKAAHASTNRSPLGACAITGTGFPIDRERTAALLGFDGTTGNTYGSIATVDYLLESVSAAAVMLTGLGRVVQDLLLWCTSEFGYLRLADGFVQCSSIMPQKRNPVALEHARAIASKGVGQATGIILSVHNTPFGDIVDTEDDLQPLVFSTFKDAVRAVRLVAAAMKEAVFDREALAARAEQGWITVTELADTLTRERDIAFKTSHTVASRFVAACAARPQEPRTHVLRDVSAGVLGRALEFSEEELARVLSPRNFVEVRTTHGGPAPTVTAKAIDASRSTLASDQEWLARNLERLDTAEAELATAIAEL